MNKELFDKLDKINDTIFDMDIKVKRINESLDQLIAALHNYDDGLEMFDHEPPNDALREAAEQYKAKVKPCVGHDAVSWEQEDELNKRMDVIGQNGNTGEHYESMEELNDEFFGKIVDDGFDDYGKRVREEDKDKSNNSDKHTVGEKKRNNGEKVLGEWQVNNKNKPLIEGRNKSQHKHGTGKTQAAPPPKPPKYKSVVEHQKYPPHKH